MSLRVRVDVLPQGDYSGAAIVVDVLRATTTATTFLEQGAAEVILAPSPAAAHLLGQAQDRPSLLAGERGGLKMDGFDLGNSPQEAAAQRWDGQSIIMNTTNGTAAAHIAARSAWPVFLGCLRNAPAAAKAALDSGVTEVTVVCAGTDGMVSMDDVYAAGALVHHLNALQPCVPDDSALIAHTLLTRWPPGDALRRSWHGRRLLTLELEADLEFCAQVGVSQCVPTLLETRGGGLVFGAGA
ncbi:2-phosphosulfolactate phosphatase [Deinococcus lacus]|uniref:Probable 2-phosphosulfolactate phosphatase n=1 Tax=Deinococcus lacus TaxID=392561 RepID=A0ABW1YE31_9DEIO